MFCCTILQAQENGIASYYSNRLQGRRTSNGERYHKDSLTCAYNRFPFGTMLKVTNIKNGKSVVVKVTDRCKSNHRIDLSYAAAKEIDLIRLGTATVEIRRLEEPDALPKE
ncbi:MAG: septal ring lytic transglycosylase RlpA family protein [Prevotella sp.]|nr:septal ring lytic transglycosylase RlpA family protein [Prevotella sp.]